MNDHTGHDIRYLGTYENGTDELRCYTCQPSSLTRVLKWLFATFAALLMFAVPFLPANATGGIAFDAATTPVITSGVGSVTWTQTVSGANRLAVISVYHDTNGDVVTGAKCGGSAATLIGKVNNTSPTDVWEYMFFCIAPPTGTVTFEVDMAAVESGNIIYSSATYTGVKQSGQPDASATNNGVAGTATKITLTTNSVADNSWAVGMMRDGVGSESAGAGTTNRALGVSMAVFDGNAAVHPAGSTSLIENFGSTPRYGGVIATFSPAPTPSTFAFWQFFPF